MSSNAHPEAVRLVENLRSEMQQMLGGHGEAGTIGIESQKDQALGQPKGTDRGRHRDYQPIDAGHSADSFRGTFNVPQVLHCAQASHYEQWPHRIDPDQRRGHPFLGFPGIAQAVPDVPCCRTVAQRVEIIDKAMPAGRAEQALTAGHFLPPVESLRTTTAMGRCCSVDPRQGSHKIPIEVPHSL